MCMQPPAKITLHTLGYKGICINYANPSLSIVIEILLLFYLGVTYNS